MKINRILIVSVVFLTAFTGYNLAQKTANGYNYAGESIQYITKPAGESEYHNLGTVDFNGVKANLITLKTRILFVEVSEKIYSDPVSLLPYKTERVTSGFWVKEYRTEEYDQEKFTVTIKISKGKKLAKEQVIKADGPIQNINLLLIYLRKQPDLKIGWHFALKVPDELKLFKFDLKLVSIDEVTVPAGTFQAYHFKSTPAKYEIWIDKSDLRVPLKIKQKSIIDCSILMKKYKAAK